MKAKQGTAHHTIHRTVFPTLTQGMVQEAVHQMVCKHVPDPKQHTEKTTSHTVPV